MKNKEFKGYVHHSCIAGEKDVYSAGEFLVKGPSILINNSDMLYQIPDKSEPYNMELLNAYLKGLLKKYLNYKEYQVLRLSYGLDCDKHSAKEIAALLNITGASDYVRVSELKKQAINKLIENVDHSQVLDYL